MSSFTETIKEFDEKHNVKPSNSLSRDEYEALHSEAKEILIKKLNGDHGKGIDVEVNIEDKKIPIEVTVLPSWKGDEFPNEEIIIKKERNKKPHQQFAYFNADLSKVTIVTQGMLKSDGDGNYRVPKKALKFYSI